MKKVFCRIFVVMILLCILVSSTLNVCAQTPYDSYTYWSDVGSSRKAVYNKSMYQPNRLIKASDIGVESFKKINDICVDDDNNVYILDSLSRVVILDDNYNLIREIGAIGGVEKYDEASSIYVSSDKTLYICDTNGKRILHLTTSGELIDIITLPSSSLIPKDFDFKPIGIVKDSYGYLYVLSDGCFYGILLYSPEGEFVSFYGSNKVVNSFTGVLKNIVERVFPNNEKKANTAQRLPYCFVDIYIDKGDFVYTSNGFTSFDDLKGQIRKLSPGTGDNILDTENINYVDSEMNELFGKMFNRQSISNIAVDDKGFVYGLESIYGKVFMYDEDGNIITAFGGGMGEGKQLGTFKSVSGLAIKGNGKSVLVADDKTNFITVFSINEFGDKVKNLIYLTSIGKYDQVKAEWEGIIETDNSFQPAYSGLARVYLSEGNYAKAMELAKIGYDKDTYAEAFKYQRQNLISKYFLHIFIVAVIVLVGIVAFFIISSKKNLTLIKNQELRMMFSAIIHPSNVFTDIKEKQLGSVKISIVLIILYYIATILQTLAGGFLFTNYDAASFNSIIVLAKSIGLIVLWIVANWMVCTLLGGKGKIREILIVTSYSLMPLIIEKFIRLIMTNILIPEETAFLAILDTVALLYAGFMLIIGLFKIHDFEVAGLVGTSILSVAGMAAIVFLLILVFILIQHFYAFIATVVSELITL